MSNYTGYAAESIQVQVIEPKLDDVIITTADETDCILTDAQGAVLTTTSLSYTATLPVTGKEGWYANLNLPSTPGRCHIHTVIVKSDATKKFHDTIMVKDFA